MAYHSACLQRNYGSSIKSLKLHRLNNQFDHKSHQSDKHYDAERRESWKKKLTCFVRYWRMFEAVATPCTVFRCVALESPNTVFKFPSLELSRALTCAVETSELPVARGAGGSWVWQLLLMQCLLAVPTTSTLHTVSAGAAMLRSNFFLSVLGGLCVTMRSPTASNSSQIHVCLFLQ